MTNDTDTLIAGAGATGSNIEEAMDELADYKGPDESFAEFLGNYIHRYNLTDARSMATLYVEGFHAAHADRFSVKGLIKTNRAVCWLVGRAAHERKNYCE